MAKTDEVRVWTPDEIATELTMRECCSCEELALLGLLLQGGAVVALPDNIIGVDGDGNPV